MPQTRVVRSYGLYHPTQAKALAVCRTALGQLPVEAPVPLTWQTVCAPRGEAHPERCPTCGSSMLERCWKCERALADPFASYCTYCGVPLKRILPRSEPCEPLLAICSNPECDGAVETVRVATLQ